MNPPAMAALPEQCLGGSGRKCDCVRWSTQTTNQAIGTGAKIGRIWGWWAWEYSTSPRPWVRSAQGARIGWGAI